MRRLLRARGRRATDLDESLLKVELEKSPITDEVQHALRQRRLEEMKRISSRLYRRLWNDFQHYIKEINRLVDEENNSAAAQRLRPLAIATCKDLLLQVELQRVLIHRVLSGLDPPDGPSHAVVQPVLTARDKGLLEQEELVTSVLEDLKHLPEARPRPSLSNSQLARVNARMHANEVRFRARLRASDATDRMDEAFCIVSLV